MSHSTICYMKTPLVKKYSKLETGILLRRGISGNGKIKVEFEIFSFANAFTFTQLHENARYL